MKRVITLMLALAALLACAARGEADAEADESGVYTMVDERGDIITQRMGRMYAGDECITSDNTLYEVVEVDDDMRVATAKSMGKEPENAVNAFAALAESAGKKLICMYSTHSDESYIQGDGDSSLLENAGIYDVGNALKSHLEEMGVDVVYSEETFHPHDAGAYRRSRSVAAELLEKNPDALIDVHRDAVPKEQYETSVDGERVSMVRLFVGKSNANASENRAFAKQLKAVADDEYPGLIKDIYIGKGNYNQDLYPQAILLEFGTHEIDKDLVLGSTEYMAAVLNNALYGANAQSAAREKQQKSGVSAGVGWLIGLSVAAAIAFALFATGSFKGAGQKLSRTFRELTGGAFTGKRK